MTDQPEIVLPNAVYFDTNALRAMPKTLNVPALAEIVEIARMMGTRLCVPRVAADEWIHFCCTDAVDVYKQLNGLAASLGVLLDRPPLTLEHISHDALRESVMEQQVRRLQGYGIAIVPTPQIDLSVLIDTFVKKMPPFTAGDRGFKDAIILKTVFSDACSVNRYRNIVLITADKIFQDAVVAQQFAQAGTQLHVVFDEPKKVVNRGAEALKDMLNRANADLIHLRMEQARSFVREHEAEVLEFATQHALIDMATIYGVFQLGQPNEADDPLSGAIIESIDAVRPSSVESAFPLLGEDRDDGRAPLTITVGVDIDLTIKRRNFFAEPRVPVGSAATLLQQNRSFLDSYQSRNVTIHRSIYVTGSAILEGRDTGEWRFRDLQLEQTVNT